MVKIDSVLVNRLLAALTLLVLVATVALLIWVEAQYRDEINTAIQSTRDMFRKANVLKAPNDIRPNFAAIEDLARRAESLRMVRHVYVVKTVNIAGSERPVLLHPFYYSAIHPNWLQDLGRLRKEPIIQEGEEVGALYFDLDLRAWRGVQMAIAVAVALIVLSLLVLMGRVFTQQRVLTATNAVLEENKRELIRLERLSLAGLLTANIFHDLRKPITNIKHELADLGEALGGFAGATRSLKNMRDQVNLYFDILRDLNIERFVGADEAEEEYVDVNRVLEQALRLVQYERGSTQISVILAPSLPLVLAHPYRLVQVFSNIILNAYQALEGHGELKLTSRAENTAVTVEFTDNGPGIPPANMKEIFSPFYTTKPPERGTGLGLYISQMIIEQLKGTLAVQSTVGQGTTFTVSLPVSE